MSWVQKYGQPIVFKNKKTQIIVGNASFDAYYKTIGTTGKNKMIKLPSGYEGRLDLVSLQVYGTSERWWEIAIANNIHDPSEQMTAGMLLKIPV
tara:strand:- start:2 stop:283 length:282 start_codon:yes stop_codon:yes gene_type:complete